MTACCDRTIDFTLRMTRKVREKAIKNGYKQLNTLKPNLIAGFKSIKTSQDQGTVANVCQEGISVPRPTQGLNVFNK